MQTEITASCSADLVTVSVDATFGDEIGCDLNFNGTKIDLDLALCCAKLRAETAFTCNGFQYATFAAEEIEIPYLSWLRIYALLRFVPTLKTLQLTPVFDFPAPECFTIYVSQASSGGVSPAPLLLGDITFDGFALDCTIGGIEFIGVSYWGPGTKPSLLSGTPYWEAYQIKTLADECCGRLGFDVTVYFLQQGLQLFDVSGVVANLSLQLAAGVSLSTGITFDFAAPTPWTKWTLGALVNW